MEDTVAEEIGSAEGSDWDRACSCRAAWNDGPVSADRARAADRGRGAGWNERLGPSDRTDRRRQACALAETSETPKPARRTGRGRPARRAAPRRPGPARLSVEMRRYPIEAVVEPGRTSEAATALADARRAMPPKDDYAAAALLLAEAWSARPGRIRTAPGVPREVPADHGKPAARARRRRGRDPLRAGTGPRRLARTSEERTAGGPGAVRATAADALITDIDRELTRLAPPTASG